MTGYVQGVGMRPFIARLAGLCRQNGWVANTAEGLTIAIEGEPDLQQQLLESLRSQLPPLASIVSITVDKQPPANYRDFQIKASTVEGGKSAYVLPDIAACAECINDIFNPDSRFYRYPFTSCTDCGPRYSIMQSLPYDRERSAMAGFALCADCARDYRSADNRRFHAQTLACPNCGPVLSLLDPAGRHLPAHDEALHAGIDYLREGKIIAIKGIGGFQLWVDAANQAAIERLRFRKHRPQKPFALMVADLAVARELCAINDLEQQALASTAAPIVLLKRREGAPVADAAAPGTDLLGVMLAYAPLHHLLLREFGAPVVATSGNREDEPICIDNDQALGRLSGIADVFLTHDRPILRPLDDSIVRMIGDKMTVLRRARGYAPLPVMLKSALPDALAVGGHLKNTIAICHDRQMILSPHIGDLDCEASQRQCEATLADLQQFYRIKPERVMRDLHDAYGSSQFAERQLQPAVIGKVQHHYAHILACMAEHGLEPPLLGVAWDGNGLGDDRTLWGGEFLRIHNHGFVRFAHFRPFSLPGGGKAIQEPRRSALGLLHEIYRERVFDLNLLPFSESELQFMRPALAKQINCPRTTSAGRLFDAVASLLGLCQVSQYEGQAAMALESYAARSEYDGSYPFRIIAGEPLVIDWQDTVEHLLAYIPEHNAELIAKKFHNTLAEMILAVARRAGEQTIVLSGGCFQNACLVEKAESKLTNAGFQVFRHQKIPPNDGGLALGQLYAAKYIG
ncbi:carbamoyltransferase HypF [Methylomicrobium sp. Wu6]|uniref:carbamoyltransferase HypF n=1 Tax=Methylomicrobium sp. Wu6 TaxID=3107928 RepID=UPI002DD65BB4|nr:carbamoyltransferase HypF [Methylomicrobium sp. Wu6]MEC4750332.1 carbamoyltransferase HypF [Methylomicrobium sp. Wu6]